MRYIIGIDLGTTNCSLSYIDTEQPSLLVQAFRIPQITDVGYVEALTSLPSFCYLASQDEFPSGSMQLPWKETSKWIIGSFAKKYGAKVPTRLVHSAKSWLCHSSASRRDPILPIHEGSNQRISPIDATASYLKLIKNAWNHKMSKGVLELEFEQQEIILTVPASFDEVARLLTLESAKAAGFTNVTLLEEPQAAFYSWIAENEKEMKKDLNVGDVILVVDVGGGTTDFSLIEVKVQGNTKVFQRMAVGDHLLLGGDNMDAAVAYELQQKIPQITDFQILQLKQEARNAKEVLLSNMEDSYKILLQGQGSHVLQGSISLNITKEEVQYKLLNGFFGFTNFSETKNLKKTAGIKSLGLPFEDEPSIIKQLGNFLQTAGVKKPDVILFNGGTMKPLIFQEAIINALNSWFPEKKVKVLKTVSLDLAVSRGAAYYGKSKRGLGVRISGGAARGYYLGLEVKENGITKNQALCCLPRGSEDGASYEPQQTFFVTPNTQVVFQLYTSHVRLFDTPGALIEISPEEMQALPEIRTILRFGKKQMNELSQNKIPVHLKIALTAIGTLEIWLISQISEHRFALEFQLKKASAQDDSLQVLEKTRIDETFDINDLSQAKNLILGAFSKDPTVKLEHLMENVEKVLEKPKQDFYPSALRGLFDVLLANSEGRLLSKQHSDRFYNIAGFFLRPGFGYPLDDFRIKDLWKIILTDNNSNRHFEGNIQSLICFRRIAGGLNKGQQMQLAKELIPEFKNGKIEIKSKADLYHYSEKIRAFASFEFIDVQTKIKVGNAILERIEKGLATDADYFALGRIGSRLLVYGTLNCLIPLKTIKVWIERLLVAKNLSEVKLSFLLSLLAAKTDLAEFNISDELVDKILKHFESKDQYEKLHKHLTTRAYFTEAEQAAIFGESLPLGISLEM
jgi:molecular chaperone DnaK (HSP70)